MLSSDRLRLRLLTLLLVATATARAECKQPLDPGTLDRLSLGAMNVQVRPGESYQFTLAILSSYAPAEVVQACVTYKVTPEGKGATIDDAGLLKIDPHTPNGAQFVVMADIEHGRAQRTIGVFVYTPEAQPLLGRWHQEKQFDCGSGEEIHTHPIRELEFRADGSFSVTWDPFETYRDYWGSYAFHFATGKLSLLVEHGNRIPGDMRSIGKAEIKNGKLVLTGIYLGTFEKAGEPPLTKNQCGYVFAR